MFAKALSWLLIIASLAFLARPCHSFASLAPLRTRSKWVLAAKPLSEQEPSDPDAFIPLLKKKAIPAILGTCAILFSSANAEAVVSGGRSGGSSFRVPSSSSRPSSISIPSRTSIGVSPTRLGGSLSTYRSSYYSQPVITPILPSPYINYGYVSYGYIPPLVPLAVTALVLYLYVSSNRISVSGFSNNEDDGGSLGSGATVMKLQIAVDSNWGSADNIMDTLSILANKNRAMEDRGDIAKLLSETCLALLRKQKDWNSVAYEAEVFGRKQKAEPRFQQIAIKERAKFEKENPEVSLIRSSSRPGSQPTQAVISLVVAMRGKSTAFSKSVKTLSEVRSCLQSLCADALIDEGENVMAVEVLWTPAEKGEVITPRELIEDYPELLRL